MRGAATGHARWLDPAAAVPGSLAAVPFWLHCEAVACCAASGSEHRNRLYSACCDHVR